jgi:hypothetical protein
MGSVHGQLVSWPVVRQNIMAAGACNTAGYSPHVAGNQRERDRGRGQRQDVPFKGMPHFLQSGLTFHSFHHLSIVHSFVDSPMD